MTYTFECDGWCDDDVHTERPALMGEFNEGWFNSSRAGGFLDEAGYDPGDIVTLCGDCTHRLLCET